jgi:hypothetical protein
MFIIVGASAQELPDVKALCERAGNRCCVCAVCVLCVFGMCAARFVWCAVCVLYVFCMCSVCVLCVCFVCVMCPACEHSLQQPCKSNNL